MTEVGEETETPVDVQDDQISSGETQVKKGIGSIIKKVEDYFSQGLIKTKHERNFLRSDLRRINFLFNQIDRVNARKGIKNNQKEKLIANLKKRINKRIDFLISHIQNKSKNLIEMQTAKSLIKDLNSARP